MENQTSYHRDIVIDFIRSRKLFDLKDNLLVGVSGGRDSMALLNLMSDICSKVGVAHVNYSLRSGESDRDEDFVRSYCEEHSIPFYVKSIEPSYWADPEDNIQSAARDIRYRYFEEIRTDCGYDYIATGHHLTDALETMIFKTLRGCGLRGVRGISPKRGFIVRPLLSLTREQIDEYIEAEEIPYREDRSNQSLKYKRNQIRRRIIPRIKEVFPDWDSGYRHTYQHLNESVNLFEKSLEELKQSALLESGDELILDKEFIRKSIAPLTLMWHLLQPFGFSPDQCVQVLEKDHSGRVFEAGEHELIEDRDRLILREKLSGRPDEFIISEFRSEFKTEWGRFTMELSDGSLSESKYEITVDRDEIRFPLTIRSRKPGDHFHPLGMDGHSKSIKEFMIDEKIPVAYKDHIPLLIDHSGKIIWVVGYRMDERFKLTEDTDEVLRIRWIPGNRA